MFSYYGSKSKLARLYPKPTHSTIIEPFAGSARYALLYYGHEVWLYDANPLIIDIWQFLIDASRNDILSLPNVESKQSLDDIQNLTDTERALVGFNLCRGKSKPRKVGHGQNNWNRDKIRIADNLWKIKHWHVGVANWYDIDPLGIMKATWFIDPPYQRTQIKTNGDRYPYGDDLDYNALGKWCLSRSGQVIVCEGEGADWLPFQLLAEVHTNTNAKTVKKNGEYVYLGV